MSYRTSFPPTLSSNLRLDREGFYAACTVVTSNHRVGFPRPGLLFIFHRAPPTLPFVYAHKYSFKPPHSGTTAGRSVSRHSSGIINRPSIVSKLPPCSTRKYTFQRRRAEYQTDENRVVRFQERHTPCVRRCDVSPRFHFTSAFAVISRNTIGRIIHIGRKWTLRLKRCFVYYKKIVQLLQKYICYVIYTGWSLKDRMMQNKSNTFTNTCF